MDKQDYKELLEENLNVNKNLNKCLRKILTTANMLEFFRDNIDKYSKEQLAERMDDWIQFLKS